MLKRFISLTFVFLFLLISLSAQEEIDYSKPQKVDEFGELQVSDILARLDQVAVQAQSVPSSRIFIVSYQTKYEPPGKIFRVLNRMKNYLTESRGLEPNRVVTIDGVTNCILTELWIVPDGKTPDVAKSYYNSFEDKESVRKFDEFYYSSDDLEYEYWSGDSLKEYTDIVKKEPKSFAYIILYPQYLKYNSEPAQTDSQSKIRRIQTEIKNRLIKDYKLSASRIKIVNGGYRDYRQVELWVLPRGKHAPIATPTEFPQIKKKSRNAELFPAP